MAWTYAKRALAFATVCNDGDDGGRVLLDRLPTATEAELIRRYAGIGKRYDLSGMPPQSRPGSSGRLADL